MTQPTKLNYVTCHFGVRGSWAAGYHTGIDYRAPVGTKVFATKNGRVVHSGWGGLGRAYGNHVVIESKHNGRMVRHLYAHLSKNRVRKGQRVRTGKVIGRSGNTGNSTAPHLHYEERVAPYGYYNHRKPQLPKWKPKRRKILNRVYRALGIRRKK